MFCYSPGKAAGMFGLGWAVLPEIVAELARWRLRTWPDVEVSEALLFLAATQEVGGVSARVEAALRDLEAWLPGPQAAAWLFGYTEEESDLVQLSCSAPELLREVLWDSLENCQAGMFTGCGAGRLHLFPALETTSREEPDHEAGPWGHSPQQDVPATLRLLQRFEREVVGLWG